MPEAQYDKEASYVQTVLETLVEPLAHTTGFVVRRSKVTGVRFVQMLVLACLERAEVSLNELAAVGQGLGVEVSGSGLNQRIDEEAVVLLRQVLAAAVAKAAPGRAEGCALFARFEAVHIEDSSYLSLPPALAEAWGAMPRRPGPKCCWTTTISVVGWQRWRWWRGSMPTRPAK